MKDVPNAVKTPLNRRSFVKTGLSAGAVGVGLLASSPTVFAKRNSEEHCRTNLSHKTFGGDEF
jgi:hypothetical protein